MRSRFSDCVFARLSFSTRFRVSVPPRFLVLFVVSSPRFISRFAETIPGSWCSWFSGRDLPSFVVCWFSGVQGSWFRGFLVENRRRSWFAIAVHVMATENFCVRFTGKNYAAWEFQFKMFVKGKGLWGHVDGTSTAPADNAALTAWQTKDAQIITWILASVDPQMINNLRSFSTAKDMWDYLKRVYNQDNAAKRFQLELDIATYRQGSLSIQDYYSGFLNLWAEHSAILHADVSKESLAAVQQVYEVGKRDQFLMKLRPEFEVVRAALLNRSPSPSLDVCLGELLREEQRLLTQGSMTHDNFVSDAVSVAYSAEGKGKGRDMTTVQCFCCKQFGHIARNCSKKFCNYCKATWTHHQRMPDQTRAKTSAGLSCHYYFSGSVHCSCSL